MKTWREHFYKEIANRGESKFRSLIEIGTTYIENNDMNLLNVSNCKKT